MQMTPKVTGLARDISKVKPLKRMKYFRSGKKAKAQEEE
jgi:hypothetical protein